MGGRGQAVFPCLPGLVSGWLWQWDTGGKWKGVGKENWGVSFPYTLPHMVALAHESTLSQGLTFWEDCILAPVLAGGPPCLLCLQLSADAASSSSV